MAYGDDVASVDPSDSNRDLRDWADGSNVHPVDLGIDSDVSQDPNLFGDYEEDAN